MKTVQEISIEVKNATLQEASLALQKAKESLGKIIDFKFYQIDENTIFWRKNALQALDMLSQFISTLGVGYYLSILQQSKFHPPLIP